MIADTGVFVFEPIQHRAQLSRRYCDGAEIEYEDLGFHRQGERFFTHGHLADRTTLYLKLAPFFVAPFSLVQPTRLRLHPGETLATFADHRLGNLRSYPRCHLWEDRLRRMVPYRLMGLIWVITFVKDDFIWSSNGRMNLAS